MMRGRLLVPVRKAVMLNNATPVHSGTRPSYDIHPLSGWAHSVLYTHLWAYLHTRAQILTANFSTSPRYCVCVCVCDEWFLKCHLLSGRWRSCTSLQIHSAPVRKRWEWTNLWKDRQVSSTQGKQKWPTHTHRHQENYREIRTIETHRAIEVHTVWVTRSIGNQETRKGKTGAVIIKRYEMFWFYSPILKRHIVYICTSIKVQQNHTKIINQVDERYIN